MVDRTTGAANAAIDWRFTVGERVKIRLVNEMDSDHPMQHPFHLHGAGRFLVLARDGIVERNLVWKDTVLVHASAKYVASADYPIGVPREVADALLTQVDQLWGTDAMAAMFVPSRAGDERFRRWWAKVLRTGASPRAAQALLRAMTEGDMRPLLPLIQRPTLLLHRRDFQLLPIEHAHYLAKHIAGSRLVELPGADMSVMWEEPEAILDLLEQFLTGVRHISAPSLGFS